MTERKNQEIKPGIDFIGITTPFYCNDGQGNFLLHKRSENARDEKGRWDFGSGQLDMGEEIEVGVLRELQEEYGVIGNIQEQVPAHSIIRTENGITTHWLAIPFFIKVNINDAKIMELHKVTEIGIFRLDNLPKPLHTGVQITMRKYKELFERYQR